MTMKERNNPTVLNASRRRRIAMGSGTSVQDVNTLIREFEKVKELIKMMTKGGKAGRKGRMKLPF